MKERIINNNILCCIVASLLTVAACVFAFFISLNTTMDQQAYSQTMLLVHILENSRQAPDAVLREINSMDIYGRITFVDMEGDVTYDSDFSYSDMESHRNRQEIADAQKNGFASARRYSNTSKQTTYYCAALVEGKGVVRLGITSSDVAGEVLFKVSPVIVVCIGVILFICIVISGATTKRIVGNIEQYDIEKGEGNIYGELSHFVNKIKRQNNIINVQLQTLKEEKEKLQSIFYSIKEGIIVCDSTFSIIQTNTEVREIFGIQDGERNFFSAVHVPELHKAMEKAVDGDTEYFNFEYNNRWYQGTASPNPYEGDQGAILIVLDITTQVENEKNRRRFTDNVTHELKTPLTSILGYSQLITNNIAKQEDIQPFVKIIETNASSLLEMIDDIIRISNLETGEGFNKIQLQLDRIVDSVARRESVAAESRGVRLYTDLEPVPILADESRMYQLCHNLISNAVKYNKEQGWVKIRLEKDGDFAKLTVEDNGIGISAEHLDKIFERFYVVDKSRNKNISSSGLGLAIVKHIVKAHSGFISVKSLPGKGSCFTVRLPLFNN